MATWGPLALVGGDELNPGNEPQDEVLVRAAGVGPAFVLATAAGRQHPEAAVANAVRWFAGLGLRIEELPATRRSDAKDGANVARAREGRFFYLVGGDPGLVPKVLAGTPLWEAIVGAWVGGAALAGSSAGAMALGEWTLVRERMPGDDRRRYLPALGLVPGVAVLPHFETFGHRWVDSAERAAPRSDVVLLGIDERTAALHHDGAWRAFGDGGVTVIAGGERRRFASGETIDGLPTPDPEGSPGSNAGDVPDPSREHGDVVDRVWNFSPGPGALPLPVLEHVRDELLEYPGAGASILEISHRSPAFERVIEEAEANLRDLLGIPSTHRVAVPAGRGVAPVLDGADEPAAAGRPATSLTGSWAKKAARGGDAPRRRANGVGRRRDRYTSVPEPVARRLADGLDYLHVTSNETIQGVQCPHELDPRTAPPLVVRHVERLPVAADRRRALRPALRRRPEERSGRRASRSSCSARTCWRRRPRACPTMLDYARTSENSSLYNTPPVFAIYVLMLVTRWLRDEIGGLTAMAERNAREGHAAVRRDRRLGGFYRGHARRTAARG